MVKGFVVRGARASPELDQLTFEEAAFYNSVRDTVVIFLFYAILLTISHFFISYFRMQLESEPLLVDKEDKLIHQIVLMICTIVLTLSLAACLSLPISIAANDILLHFPDSYYIQWLNGSLFIYLFNSINIGTRVCYVVLPFAYFFLESQGFFIVRQSALCSRAIDAFVSLIFAYILIFGCLWTLLAFASVVRAFIFQIDSDAFYSPPVLCTSNLHTLSSKFLSNICWSFFVFFLRMLNLIHLFASFSGLAILLFCVPVGLINICLLLLTSSVNSRPSMRSRSNLRDVLCYMTNEELCLCDQIKNLKFSRVLHEAHTPMRVCSMCCFKRKRGCFGLSHDQHCFLNPQNELRLFQKLSQLQLEISKIEMELHLGFFHIWFAWIRPLFYLLTMLLILCLFGLFFVYVIFNMLSLFVGLILGYSFEYGGKNSWLSSFMIFSEMADQSTNSASFSFALGSKPSSMLGQFGSVLQVLLIAFLLMTSLWGFYSFPTFRKLCPHPHQTEMACVLANVTCFLLISSSLPLQARLLGLTPFALAPMFFDYHSSTESSTFDAAKTPQSIQLYSIFPKSSLEIPQLVSQRFSSETTLRSKEVGAMEFVTRSVYSNKRKSHLFDNSVPSSSSTLLALHKVSEDDTYKSLSVSLEKSLPSWILIPFYSLLAEPTINIEDRISALKSSSASNLVNQPFSAIESQSSSDVKVTSLIDPQTSNPLLPIEFDKILLSMFPGAGSSGGGGVYENSYFFLLVYNLAFLCLSLIMTGPQLRLLLAAGQAELAVWITQFYTTIYSAPKLRQPRFTSGSAVSADSFSLINSIRGRASSPSLHSPLATATVAISEFSRHLRLCLPSGRISEDGDIGLLAPGSSPLVAPHRFYPPRDFPSSRF